MSPFIIKDLILAHVHIWGVHHSSENLIFNFKCVCVKLQHTVRCMLNHETFNNSAWLDICEGGALPKHGGCAKGIVN